MPFTVAEIARHVGGEVVGDATLVVQRFAPADRAQPGDLTFAENERFFARAEQSAATAILVDGPMTSQKTLIRVPSARLAFARVLPLFFPEPIHPAGVHPSAVIASTARVDASAHIGPLCVVGEAAVIGPRTVVSAQVYVGPECVVGADCLLFPHVTLYARTVLGNRVRIHAGSVIGADGFGYVQDGGVHRKVPQVGHVLIRDDVEIGANVTVDRGALGPTVIGQGTKIDNLVQIAHNVKIGADTVIVSLCAIAGSTTLGQGCVLGGQVAIDGHLTLGDRVMIAAKSGVTKDWPSGSVIGGYPAQDHRADLRLTAELRKLVGASRRLEELERKLSGRSSPEVGG